VTHLVHIEEEEDAIDQTPHMKQGQAEIVPKIDAPLATYEVEDRVCQETHKEFNVGEARVTHLVSTEEEIVETTTVIFEGNRKKTLKEFEHVKHEYEMAV